MSALVVDEESSKKLRAGNYDQLPIFLENKIGAHLAFKLLIKQSNSLGKEMITRGAIIDDGKQN